MTQSPGRNSPSSSSKTQDPDGSANGSAPPTASAQAEMAQAFRDLARGEQQAAAIEANLTSLESKLDALLASIEGGSNGSAASQGKGAGAGDDQGSAAKKG